MSADQTTDTTEVPPPGFIVPGVRCALEMLLVGAVLLYAGLPATNAVYLGFVVVLTVVAMVVVLFWCLNQQMEAWIARARRTAGPDTE
jgi:type IV secretory pathway TrbD component